MDSSRGHRLIGRESSMMIMWLMLMMLSMCDADANDEVNDDGNDDVIEAWC